MASPQNDIYHVHIYREMRLYFPGIRAASAKAAAHLADAKATPEADFIDDCDGETIAALVDVEGDTEYACSQILDFEPARLRNAASALLAALIRFEAAWHDWANDMRRHPGLSESCKMFSIYEQARTAIHHATKP